MEMAARRVPRIRPGEFWVWWNRPEQEELHDALQRMAPSNRQILENARSGIKSGHPLMRESRCPWHRIDLASTHSTKTRRGSTGAPLGHTRGLNLLSELTIRRPPSDAMVTSPSLILAWVGNSETSCPRPLIVISQRFREILARERIKGYSLEVAHIAD
jgi:hypothetical protein